MTPRSSATRYCSQTKNDYVTVSTNVAAYSVFRQLSISSFDQLFTFGDMCVYNMGMDEDSLEYHEEEPPGKIEISTTKPTNTQRDLSLAYSPGVAAPCRKIRDDAEDAYKYTAKGNLVGVVSNGSAVLGLGDIGPEASKPVMEGKGVLFKRFADIDVFDIELDHSEPEQFVESVAAMEPTSAVSTSKISRHRTASRSRGS